MYVAPQLVHAPAPTAAVTRVPQCPQKGRVESTSLLHFTQATAFGGGATRVAGISASGASAAPLMPASAPDW
jgi:hypothetical protein